MQGQNSLTEIEQRLHRKVRQSIVVSAVAIAIFAIMGALFLIAVGLPPASEWQVWYTYGILIVAIVIVATLPRAVARSMRGIIEFLQRIQPRTNDAKWERFSGARVVFDNGLAFQQFISGGNGPRGFLFTAFIAADGSVLKPNADDVTTLARSFRPLREKIGTVTRKKGPAESQAALEGIRSRLGAKRGFSVLDGHASSMDLPATSPRWMAGAVCFDNKWYTKGDQVLATIDETLSFLKALPTRNFATQ
jgi:hypothetical protein